MKKITIGLVLVVAAGLVLSACGGGGGGGTTNAGLNNAKQVNGSVLAPNSDPIPGATVYIVSGSVNLTRKFMRTKLLKATSSDGTATCSDPAAGLSCATTCSGADGNYTLDTSTCTGTETQMVVQKGTLQTTVNLNCTSDPCTTNVSFGSDAQWPKVAVVAGQFDKMQDVLAKLAPAVYGTVDSSGILQPGSENKANLTLISGDGANLGSEYNTFDQYLDGTLSLDGFDILFINCTCYGGPCTYRDMLSQATVRDRLTAYVNNGGRVYVTDLSYDYINQVWPSFMNFEGDVNETTPGAIAAADNGVGGETPNATVHDNDMKAWLKNVVVNAHDANTPGNPDPDCGTTITRTGALNADDTIPIGDFLGGWARMVGVYATDTVVWIMADIDSLANRPLTASEPKGSNGGALFYSSYHTADSCPTIGFWPQERILQYLIFEAF